MQLSEIVSDWTPFTTSAARFTDKIFDSIHVLWSGLLLARLHSVGGRLVMLAGVCRRLSVTLHGGAT